MKRRSFLQWVLGVLGVGAVGVPKPEKQKAVLTLDAVKDWKSPHAFDFMPDNIVGVENWQGHFFIICEHSVWEIYEDYEGQLRRKLKNYT